MIGYNKSEVVCLSFKMSYRTVLGLLVMVRDDAVPTYEMKCSTQNGTQFKTNGSYISGILNLTFPDHA